MFAIAIYGGYFGAAAGVVMLAMFLLATGEGLPRGNAMKNVILGVANGVAALGYILFASVAWSAALPWRSAASSAARSVRGSCAGLRRPRCGG